MNVIFCSGEAASEVNVSTSFMERTFSKEITVLKIDYKKKLFIKPFFVKTNL